MHSDQPVSEKLGDDDIDSRPTPTVTAPKGPSGLGRAVAPATQGYKKIAILSLLLLGGAFLAFIGYGLFRGGGSSEAVIAAASPMPVIPTVSEDKAFYQKHADEILVKRTAPGAPIPPGGTANIRYGSDGKPLVDSSFNPSGRDLAKLATGPSGLGLPQQNSTSVVGQPTSGNAPLTYSQVPIVDVTPAPRSANADFNQSSQRVPPILPVTSAQQFPDQARQYAGAVTGEGATEVALMDTSAANSPVERYNPSQASSQVASVQETQTVPASSQAARQPSSREQKDILSTVNQRYDTPYVVQSGSFIPGILITGVDSELPGLVIAQVITNVYDSGTHTHILIPAGTRVIGLYKNAVAVGGSRLFLGWDRLLFPNGQYRDIDGFAGTDSHGQSGVSGRVDSHRGRALGQALLYTVLSAVGTIATAPKNQVLDRFGNPPSPSPAQQAASTAAGNLINLGTQQIQQTGSQAPTVHIDPSTRISIIVDHDMQFVEPNG